VNKRSNGDSPVQDIYGRPYHRGLLIILLLVGTFLSLINSTLLTTAIPVIMRDLGIDASAAQWLSTGFMLVNGIMIPVSALLYNKFHTRQLFIGSMAVLLVGTILIAISGDSFAVLLGGRLIQAVGAGIVLPLLQVVMLTIYPPERRGSMMGVFSLVLSISPAIGPTLSGWFIDQWPWHWMFRIMIGLIAAIIIMATMIMRDVNQVSAARIDGLSIILSSFGFGLFLFGVSSAGGRGWGDSFVLACISSGLLLIAWFAWRQFRLAVPILELRVFQSSQFTLNTVIGGVIYISMMGASVIMPIYSQNIRGLPALQSGMIMLPGATLMAFGSLAAGRLYDRFGARTMVMIGLVFLTLSSVPLAFLNLTTPVPLIAVYISIRYIGIAFGLTPLTIGSMNALPQHLISHGSAANNTVRQIAGSIGIAILVSVMMNFTAMNMPVQALAQSDPAAYQVQKLAAQIHGINISFIFAGCFAVIALIMSFFIRDQRRMTVRHLDELAGVEIDEVYNEF
jgi:EmrB/QacA subfamily drug resistance transporter